MADRMADRLGGDDGDELYARICTHIFGFEPEWMRSDELDWARVQRGFEVILRRYPGARWNINAYGVFASIRGDRAACSRALALIGDRPYLSVWIRRDYFEAVKKWVAGSEQELPPFPWPRRR